ncbi:MAG: DUF1788 domain-containing protein [Spirochaetia bacterium]|nr:DUF1788 domain-containing protein [Spirochaetia bacterium]
MHAVSSMMGYDPQSQSYLQKKLAGLLEAIQRPGFFDGLGLGNNYPSFVFEYEPAFEPLIEKAIVDLEGFLAEKRPDVLVSKIHLFDFARDYLAQQGKWEKSLQLEIQKGPDFIFGNLTRTLSGSTIAEHFLRTALHRSPGIILIHGVGMAWPILRGHEVLKNLPQRMQELNKKIPLVLFYPGEYDGKYLKPFGLFDDNNEYQAIRWQYS